MNRFSGSNVILAAALLGMGFFGFVIYKNIKAYSRYGYYVYGKDENLFEGKINPSDPKILEHGRVLLNEITKLDREIDDGDGSKRGKVRWIRCHGIDCDEGWESFAYK
jgi:hypothetical protein